MPIGLSMVKGQCIVDITGRPAGGVSILLLDQRPGLFTPCRGSESCEIMYLFSCPPLNFSTFTIFHILMKTK